MNSIYIEVLKSNIEPLSFLLQEGFTIDAKSEYGSFSELIPGGFGDLINFAINASSVSADKKGAGIVYMSNVLDLKRWTKTNPASINATIKFYTKEDVVTDVWLPMNFFMGLGILSRAKVNTITDKKTGAVTKTGGGFISPGASLNSCGLISKELSGNTNDKGTGGTKKSLKDATGEGLNFETIRSKIVSVWIPGVIYMPYAFIEACTPTYSPHIVRDERTKQDYPLWGECQLTISGLTSAIDDIFNDSNKVIIEDLKKQIITRDTADTYPAFKIGELNEEKARNSTDQKTGEAKDDVKG